MHQQMGKYLSQNTTNLRLFLVIIKMSCYESHRLWDLEIMAVEETKIWRISKVVILLLIA